MQGARGGAEVHDNVHGSAACVSRPLDQLFFVQVLVPLNNVNPANARQSLRKVKHAHVLHTIHFGSICPNLTIKLYNTKTYSSKSVLQDYFEYSINEKLVCIYVVKNTFGTNLCKIKLCANLKTSNFLVGKDRNTQTQQTNNLANTK